MCFSSAHITQIRQEVLIHLHTVCFHIKDRTGAAVELLYFDCFMHFSSLKLLLLRRPSACTHASPASSNSCTDVAVCVCVHSFEELFPLAWLGVELIFVVLEMRAMCQQQKAGRPGLVETTLFSSISLPHSFPPLLIKTRPPHTVSMSTPAHFKPCQAETRWFWRAFTRAASGLQDCLLQRVSLPLSFLTLSPCLSTPTLPFIPHPSLQSLCHLGFVKSWFVAFHVPRFTGQAGRLGADAALPLAD